MEGTAIIKLEFRERSFSAEGSAVTMANGLSRNASVSHIRVMRPLDQAVFNALATALLSNSTSQRLEFYQGYSAHLQPVFFTLGKNVGLKTHSVDVHV
jgi:hypothetical protein